MTPRQRKAAASAAGLVVATHGRRFLVELAGGAVLSCVTRGKRGGLACGDRVEVQATGPGEGVVGAALPRTTLFYRSDPYREKLIAANVDQVVIVTAPDPPLNEELLTRSLVAAEAQGVRILIVLNKADLAPRIDAAQARLVPYAALGYELLPLSAKRDPAPLRARLEGRTSVLVGQSGVGKSTLVNALVPGADAATGELSTALNAGRHTTTHSRLYHLDAQSTLIDSPGMQEFGLAHLREDDLERGFIEFRPHLGHCRFRDCRHIGEPGCAIADAVRRGKVSEQRLEYYRRLNAAVSRTPRPRSR